MLKIAFKKPRRFPSLDLYKQSGILSIRQSYVLKIILFYKIHDLNLTKVHTNYPTRLLGKYLEPGSNTRLGERFSKYYVPRILNLINCDFEGGSKRVLKNYIKKWLNDNFFVQVLPLFA